MNLRTVMVAYWVDVSESSGTGLRGLSRISDCCCSGEVFLCHSVYVMHKHRGFLLIRQFPCRPVWLSCFVLCNCFIDKLLGRLFYVRTVTTLWTHTTSSFRLSVPRYNYEFGSRGFRISAPKIWNLLPASIRNSPSLRTFSWHLKTHNLQSAYPNPLMTTPSQRARILYRRRRFINYLLTYLLKTNQIFVVP